MHSRNEIRSLKVFHVMFSLSGCRGFNFIEQWEGSGTAGGAIIRPYIILFATAGTVASVILHSRQVKKNRDMFTQSVLYRQKELLALTKDIHGIQE